MQKKAGQFASGIVAVLACVWSGCGGATSIDERWDSDANQPSAGEGESVEPSGSEPQITQEWSAVCSRQAEPEQFEGYRPVPAEGFWLGSQEVLPLRVDGPGYFARREGDGSLSFARNIQLRVTPAGVLADQDEAPVLGYHTTELAGGPCPTPLQVPQFAPPQPTRQVSATMNLDPRDFVTAFDLSQPDATSNFAVTLSVFDSLGGTHIVDIYFVHDFAAGDFSFSYHVLVDGGDVRGGTPGYEVEVSAGTLQFTGDGALDVATTPPACFSFVGATPNQCINIDFGGDIRNDGTSGLGRTTSFVSGDMVTALYVDGNTVGTGQLVNVDVNGEVSVLFDNGTGLAIGKLALARFAREAALETDEGGHGVATVRSGPAQFGKALSPGRGSVQNANDFASTPGFPSTPELDASGLGL